MTMPNAGKNMEKMDNSYIDGENVGSTATLKPLGSLLATT